MADLGRWLGGDYRVAGARLSRGEDAEHEEDETSARASDER
jgi:hypothetical protein